MKDDNKEIIYNKEKIITSIDDISLLQDKLQDEQKEFKAICSLTKEFRNMILRESEILDKNTFCFCCDKSILIESAKLMDGLYCCNDCFEKRKDIIFRRRTSKINLFLVEEQIKELEAKGNVKLISPDEGV
ncbi:hypothetical protein BTT_64360 (plasmid) [Bacillus thuringiensis serovar morrisoni str. 4AA1]|uniref:hypothetical protein n=1 Tax=Bacillus TaxID=1386 RepID=UPI000AB5E5C3|nr:MULTISPECIES: hypothetical protein [Bacillus]MED3102239.1 hypothetical protein [Bacillus thuringiensis]UOC05183.1 hypothetical protein BTT_64360 [Bacillus thuringiensis serovar morrisoni str. 4AA1]WMR09853.1 hypothetical protein RCI28_29590 [Bacillus thuringiensis serovar tenebrionis]WMR16267.1 hypothetical protein RCI27_31740 [Bacillus thuringiensis serovar tenebrionis]WMR22327.1 hypothetical protein RCI26_31685 [Bacillus thuringiensis serovar tenebrionis]